MAAAAEIAAAAEKERMLVAQVDSFINDIENTNMDITRTLGKWDVNIDNHMDEAVALNNGIKVQREARNHVQTELEDKIRGIHERTSASLLQERRERHHLETHLELLSDEKAGEVRGYLAEDMVMQKESERYAKEICGEVCHLYNNIEQVRQYRTEKGKSIAEVVRYKLNEIHDAVAAEQRLRLDSRDTLLEFFRQKAEKMEKELEASRRERHEATDRFIKVMETMLPRLDAATKKKVRACTNELNENNSAGRMAKTLAETCQARKNSLAMSQKAVLS